MAIATETPPDPPEGPAEPSVRDPEERLELLRQAGAQRIHVICIVAAPEGVSVLESHFPHVHIFTPVVDQGLNARKFIVPGLGDFGDRLYGTN